MKRREELYLVDIVEAAWKIDSFLEGVALERFQSSDLDQSAVVFQLMVIGEASGKLAPKMRDRFRGIPWEQIRGFRNPVVHGYFDLQWSEVWRIATQEVLPLREQAETILSELNPAVFAQLLARRKGESAG